MRRAGSAGDIHVWPVGRSEDVQQPHHVLRGELPGATKAPHPDGGPDLFVITGIPASGKSTVARALADRQPRSVCVEGDVLRVMVRRGREEMTAEQSPIARAQLQLRYIHTIALARSFLAAGFDTVVEDVILGSHLRPFLDDLGDRDVYLIVLSPSAEAIAQREAHRTKTAYGVRWTLDGLNEVLELETPRLGLWLDSSTLSVEETVDEILERRSEALIHASA